MIYLIAGIALIILILMLSGLGKNTVFTKPHTMSDAMIDHTIRLSQKMMDKSKVGSEAWIRAGSKFSAALNEQRRRQGLAPLSTGNAAENVERVTKNILDLVYCQLADDDGDVLRLEGEGPEGFGVISGYLFGFVMTYCAENRSVIGDDIDNCFPILESVFAASYSDPDLGIGILNASGGTSEYESPQLHEGYALGRSDAKNWLNSKQSPDGLSRLRDMAQSFD